jgi:cytochrome c oxidase assembly factor CtaG
MDGSILVINISAFLYYWKVVEKIQRYNKIFTQKVIKYVFCLSFGNAIDRKEMCKILIFVSKLD